MIPRTKVNYSLAGLARAAIVSEKDGQCRHELTRRLADRFETRHILLTGSGRGALYILLCALPQRRVLVPAYTCKAVIEAARLAGKEILYGESEECGFNMTPQALKGSLDQETILVATHQFGIPCDIHCMLEIARARGAFVIEDAAASLGSRIRGRLTGSFGDAAFFSFDSTKLVNVPLKAGFLLVRDPDVFRRCQDFVQSNCRPMPLLRKLHYLLLGAILIGLEQPSVYRLFHNIK